MSIGTVIKLYDEDGFVLIQPDDEPRIDAAVTSYIDSGGTRDSLLRLTTIAGEEYVTLASTVRSWVISTPEGRRRQVENEKALADEHRAHRHAVGLWDEEE